MVRILDHLYLGNLVESRNEDSLIANGVTQLLCVAESFRYPRSDALAYLHLPLADDGGSTLRSAIERSVKFIEQGRDVNGKTFLFCRFAQNRSPSIAIGYLMSSLSYTMERAYLTVATAKSDISPHESYFQQLQELDLELHGRISFSEADRDGSVQDHIRRLRRYSSED